MKNRVKLCPKCLSLVDVAKDEKTSLERYINNLDEDEKASDFLYEERLLICDTCPHRREVFCGKCGCYISVRAIKKSSHCPSEEHKW